MQTASFMVWTQVAESTSSNDNRYAMSTLLIQYQPLLFNWEILNFSLM